MERVAAKWPVVLTPARVAEMMAFCHSLQHNEERPFSFAVSHGGEITSFGIMAFADDTVFPDVEFFSFPRSSPPSSGARGGLRAAWILTSTQPNKALQRTVGRRRF